METVAGLRAVLPAGMPIYLEETGSSAGCYTPFHDTTGEAAFVVPYVAAMHPANLSGAHCAAFWPGLSAGAGLLLLLLRTLGQLW